MKSKSIEDLLERVKTWPASARVKNGPASAQGDLAQAALGIEADIERGVYDETYVPTDEEREALEPALKQADEGQFVSDAEIKALFAKYRRP
jgi:hypothetical protein